MTEVGTYILRQKEQTIFCKTNNPNLPKRKNCYVWWIYLSTSSRYSYFSSYEPYLAVESSHYCKFNGKDAINMEYKLYCVKLHHLFSGTWISRTELWKHKPSVIPSSSIGLLQDNIYRITRYWWMFKLSPLTIMRTVFGECRIP
jgi:hypothetical protein